MSHVIALLFFMVLTYNRSFFVLYIFEGVGSHKKFEAVVERPAYQFQLSSWDVCAELIG